MNINIAGKGSLDTLLSQKKLDFKYFELYLKTIRDFDPTKVKKLQQCTQVISVHQPTYIRINNRFHEFNLLADGPIGQHSLKVLNITVNRAKSLGIKTVVLHGTRYAHQQHDENWAINTVINQINQMPNKQLISLEYDVLWRNTYDNNLKPLMVSNKVFQSVISSTNCHITLDIEHFFITSFYLLFNYSHPLSLSSAQFEFAFKRWIKINTIIKVNAVYLSLKKFIFKFKNHINHLHINGSDWFNYQIINNHLPFIGEHLPIKYQTKNITDQLNYLKLYQVLKPLNKQIYAVLELDFDETKFDYFKKMLESKQNLEYLWR